MILICERCYGAVDPETEPYVRLAHIEHAAADGTVSWRDAVAHTGGCVPAGTVVPASERGHLA
ncbi:hypothetical protein [Pseudonocardia phyllosphaerae]|uniref:hypothetical protein n=1 Tax=Pseudonocardia phyllosphaerae TaxID=3390502 RepID=UPI003979082D